jgi:ribosome maturation factor RimP
LRSVALDNSTIGQEDPMSSSRARILALITPEVDAAGYDLEDLSVSSAGRRRLVRVIVDRDGGVSLDDTAALSRRISDALDADDDVLGAGPFVLEVTSPGVDRPLTLERHWRRNLGRLVRIEGADVDGGTVLGRIEEVQGPQVVLSTPDGDLTVDVSTVSRAVVQVELNRPSVSTDDADDVAADDAADLAEHDDAPHN